MKGAISVINSWLRLLQALASHIDEQNWSRSQTIESRLLLQLVWHRPVLQQ